MANNLKRRSIRCPEIVPGVTFYAYNERTGESWESSDLARVLQAITPNIALMDRWIIEVRV